VFSQFFKINSCLTHRNLVFLMLHLGNESSWSENNCSLFDEVACWARRRVRSNFLIINTSFVFLNYMLHSKSYFIIIITTVRITYYLNVKHYKCIKFVTCKLLFFVPSSCF
jgi:hypothetical protein